MRTRLSFYLVSVLVLGLGASSAAFAQAPGQASLAGDWTGSLAAGGQNLPIVFHITEKGGALAATWDSPSQGALGLPTKSVSLDGSALTIDIPVIRGGYTGTLQADGSTIKGSWKQGGASLPLDLVRGAAAAAPRRPQTPVAPFPYTSQDVKIPGGTKGVTLAGSLTLPPGKGPFPAIVIVSGSGPQDRDETIMGHRPFLVVADYLARRGIAVLRYDDRGFAASTGDFQKASTFDLAADAQAALDWLAARKEIDRKRVGIAGHSEGGLIAPIVASRDPAARFAILLAGPGLPGEQILYLQGSAIARVSGASEADIAQGMQVNKALYAAAMAPGTDEEAAARVRKAYADAVEADAGSSPAEKAEAMQKADEIAGQLASPWMRTFLSLDPAPYLAKVAVPTLALNGGLDLQVPPDENLSAIAKAFADAGHASLLTTRKLGGLNHLFQHAKTGGPDEYAGIEETFAPEALAAIADWILAR